MSKYKHKGYLLDQDDQTKEYKIYDDKGEEVFSSKYKNGRMTLYDAERQIDNFITLYKNLRMK